MAISNNVYTPVKYNTKKIDSGRILVVEHFGEWVSAVELAVMYGLSPSGLRGRIRKGIPLDHDFLRVEVVGGELDGDLMTHQELVEYYGVCKKTITTQMHNGKFIHKKFKKPVGGTKKIPREFKPTPAYIFSTLRFSDRLPKV